MSSEHQLGIRPEIILGSKYTNKYNKKHHRKTGEVSVYLPNVGWIAEHRLIAQAVAGRALPRTVEVHHLDGNPSNNAHVNLVVCQDHAYHMLIHNRAKALTAGKPADHRRCSRCGEWFPESHYYRKQGQYLLTTCKPCLVKYHKCWRKNNPERARALDQKWKSENADRVRMAKTIYMRKWRAANNARLRQRITIGGHPCL